MAQDVLIDEVMQDLSDLLQMTLTMDLKEVVRGSTVWPMEVPGARVQVPVEVVDSYVANADTRAPSVGLVVRVGEGIGLLVAYLSKSDRYAVTQFRIGDWRRGRLLRFNVVTWTMALNLLGESALWTKSRRSGVKEWFPHKEPSSRYPRFDDPGTSPLQWTATNGALH